MQTYLLEREQWLPAPLEEVYSFFSRPENLQVLTPPWLDFRMVEAPLALAVGSLIHYRLCYRVVPIRWTTEISEWNPPHGFVDRAVSGPYALWNHEHWFAARNGGTTMRDRVTYALPFGWIGRLWHWAAVRRDVERTLRFERRRCGDYSRETRVFFGRAAARWAVSSRSRRASGRTFARLTSTHS